MSKIYFFLTKAYLIPPSVTFGAIENPDDHYWCYINTYQFVKLNYFS